MKEQSIILENQRLKVEIGYPGSIYSGSRFDWTGFVTQVTLDNRHTFCTVESMKPGEGCGGIGLCNEFGILHPIGFEEAQVGEKFPKIGVGLLEKQDGEEYCFYKPYEIQPYVFEVTTSENEVRFAVLPHDCRGDAVELYKIIRLRGHMMEVEYFLKNVGSKEIRTNEYNHNFVALNERAVGPKYELKLPHEIEPEEVPDVLEIEGKRITWNRTPDYDFYIRVPGFETGGGFSWELTNSDAGIGMREYSDFPIQQFALWGRAHVVSPEVFREIVLLPGESMRWKRTYEFFRI